MKDNNKRMDNQGRNNNHRNVTFVEELGSIVRRNSTIPQAVSGKLSIINGDVEAVVTVNCSNAIYRNKQQPTAIDNSVQAPVQHDAIITAKQELENLKEKHAESSFSEKLADDYYNKSYRLKTKISNAEDEDLLVNILTGLQLIKAFESFIYSIRKNVTIINERDVEEVRLDYALMRFGIAEEKAAEVFSRIHDCLGFDVFTIKAKDNHVYITCGNVDGTIETFCSTSKETSMQFITRMMEANKP